MADAVDMVTTAELLAQLEKTGTERNTLYAALITAASQAINDRYYRELTPQTASATRTFYHHGDGRVVDLFPYDLRSATTVTLDPGGADEQTLTVDQDYTLAGHHRLAGTYLQIRLAEDLDLGSTFRDRFGFTRISVAGAWGAWDTDDVPEQVKRACIATVASWSDRAIAAYQADRTVIGHPAETTDLGRALTPASPGTWAIPPAAHSLLCAAGIPRLTTV